MELKSTKPPLSKAPFKDLQSSTPLQIKEVLVKLPVFLEVKDSILFNTSQVDSSLHQEGCWTARRNYNAANTLTIKSTLEEVLSFSCKECSSFTHLSSLSAKGTLLDKHRAALASLTSYLFNLPMVFNSRRVTAKTTSSTIHKKLQRLSYLQYNMKQGFQVVDPVLFPILHALLSDMYNEVEVTTKALKEVLNVDSFKDKALSLVKEKLIPPNFKGNSALLDETESLIGIYPNPLKVWSSNKIKGVITSFQVKSTSDFLILKGPRYLETYMFHALTALNGTPFLVTAITYPKDIAVAEVAANLWDPKSNSELASLKNALISAEKVIS